MIKQLLIFAAFLALPTQASAQATLQGAGGGLQPQAGQTQNTQSLQNQTADLQTNNPGSSLSKPRPNSLGVVSNPKQTRPDAVALADPNLKTDLTKGEGTNYLQILFAVLIVIYAGGVMYWAYRRYYAPRPIEELLAKEESTPALREKPKKKKKAPTASKGGKKRKSKRRY